MNDCDKAVGGGTNPSYKPPIDWKKPLRTTMCHQDINVVADWNRGNRLISWKETSNSKGDLFAIVNSRGGLIATLHHGSHCSAEFIENVPEEPRDHLFIAKGENGKWTLTEGSDGQLFTQAHATAMTRMVGDKNSVALKVAL